MRYLLLAATVIFAVPASITASEAVKNLIPIDDRIMAGISVLFVLVAILSMAVALKIEPPVADKSSEGALPEQEPWKGRG